MSAAAERDASRGGGGERQLCRRSSAQLRHDTTERQCNLAQRRAGWEHSTALRCKPEHLKQQSQDMRALGPDATVARVPEPQPAPRTSATANIEVI